MTERERAELLSELGELTRLCPEMRFGQLIANLAVVARGTEAGTLWEMEDEELLAAVKWQITELRAPGPHGRCLTGGHRLPPGFQGARKRLVAPSRSLLVSPPRQRRGAAALPGSRRGGHSRRNGGGGPGTSGGRAGPAGRGTAAFCPAA